MAKGRYQPLAAPPPAIDAASSTYSTITSSATTTNGAQPQPPTLTNPPPSSVASQLPRRVGGSGSGSGPRRQSPFYCSCAPLVRVFQRVFPERAKAVGYSSGALFTIAWWLFIDGLVYHSTRQLPPDSPPLPPARFEDWLPGILSTLSLIIVNLIDKDSLNADDFSYSGGNVACKARACAFIGITMAMGALGGSFAILAMKYLVPGLSGEDTYFGVMITLQNILIFAGSMTLWFGRNGGNDDGYGADSYGF
ncbi:UPF0220-domain-containing protein [Rhizoclosmatium globosum]|uniref:UPF0220-domain-containing protein n=1 Tax=Rhizoclosmatium globosum TaxID=329046 RepID=A0A1Y2BS75_9FUNG|nr:UPF0220-domain-containing protein [Rhizoclosmatium globosum]|eukprot:ORY37574.1 UPF0220-domain-containing protein [Rhizoclosmatium globosum]